MSDRITIACERLQRGDDVEAVLVWLRARCPTVAALSNTFTRLKKALRERGVAPPVQLKLSTDELLQHKRAQEARLLAKQSKLLHLHNAGAWLAYATELARTAHGAMDVPRLVLPLLLLCGRRSSELLNGRSTFTPTARATACFFDGALKKRGTGGAFEIPLLCDRAIFLHALAALREAQKGEVLDEVACNNRYHRMLTLALPTVFPWAPSPHALRAVYAQFVYHLYQCDCTFNLAAMKCLGHAKLDVSLSYNAVQLHDAPAVSLGPLP